MTRGTLARCLPPHPRAITVLELELAGGRVEPTIIRADGLAIRPRRGAEVEFLAPVAFGELVALELLIDGRPLRWAELRGADRLERAHRLLRVAQARYLDDGATLDAVALLREL